MPVRNLPAKPDLNHLKYQAKDLLKAQATRNPEVAQRLREFHPRFNRATDAAIFEAPLKLSDAQLAIAREHGFASWARLKKHIEKPTLTDNLKLPHHERIEDATFRRAVDLLDAGDVTGLRSHLKQHPNLVHQHVVFEGGNYFRNPTLLEFAAENPVRHGALPSNILVVTKVILDAGVERSALNETLGLVSTGRVPRECGVQLKLIDLLCDHGADPNSAILAAALHGELEAVNALIRHGARIDLPVAAALGRIEDARLLLSGAGSEDRHLALALASQLGHVEVVRLLLDAGEDPNRYNPGHSHSTPLHQAAGAGHEEVVRLLVERGARLDMKDILWQATPADWARHEGRAGIEAYLRAQNTGSENRAERSALMTAKRFRARLGGEAGGLFVTVPFDVKREFGKARPPVNVSINGVEYSSTVSVYGGKYYVPVRKERREEAGVKIGDIVEVTLQPDTEERTIEPPPELAAALARNDGAKAQWERLSYSHKKEYADVILQAKRPETRARRIQKTLEELTGKTR